MPVVALILAFAELNKLKLPLLISRGGASLSHKSFKLVLPSISLNEDTFLWVLFATIVFLLYFQTNQHSPYFHSPTHQWPLQWALVAAVLNFINRCFVHLFNLFGCQNFAHPLHFQIVVNSQQVLSKVLRLSHTFNLKQLL